MRDTGPPHAIALCTKQRGLLPLETFLAEDHQSVIRHYLRQMGLSRKDKYARYNLVRENLVYLRAIIILTENAGDRSKAASFLTRAVDLTAPEGEEQEKFLSFLKDVLPKREGINI